MTNINTRLAYIPGGFRLLPNEWTPTIHGIPRSILTTRDYDLRRFGAASAFGAVYRLVGTDFIIKIMKRGTRSDVKIFDNEVSVGSTPGIGDVGPRIYAYKKTPTQMVYIMNNIITQTNTSHGHRLLTLSDYYNNILRKVCPLPGHPIYKELSQTLVKFYTLTKGWHGDLHDQNILVIVDRNDNVLSTKIIDYGAHQKFTRGVPACLRDIFTLTQAEFNIRGHPEHTFPRFGRTKEPAEGQMYRINQNVLKMVLGNNFVQGLTNTNNAMRVQPVATQPRPPRPIATQPRPPRPIVTQPRPPRPIVTQPVVQQVPVAIPHRPILNRVLNKINTKLLMNIGKRGLVLAKNIGKRGLIMTKNIGTRGIATAKKLIKNELNRRQKIMENKERKKIANRILFEAEQAEIANKIIAEETAKVYKREKESEERRKQKQIELNKHIQNEFNKQKQREQNMRKRLNLNNSWNKISPFQKAKQQVYSMKPKKYKYILTSNGKLSNVTK